MISNVSSNFNSLGTQTTQKEYRYNRDYKKISDDIKKSTGKIYENPYGDNKLLEHISKKIGESSFHEFSSIFYGLKGADKSWFLFAGMNAVNRIDDLNYIARERLDSVDATSFLKAVSNSETEVAGELLDLGKQLDDDSMYVLVSGISNLHGKDAENFIKAVHNQPSELQTVYEMTFALNDKDRSMFLSAASNAKSELRSLLKWTGELGKNILGNKSFNGHRYFLGLDNTGNALSGKYENGKFTETGVMPFERLADTNYGTDETTDINDLADFRLFIGLASKSGKNADSYLKLVNKSGFDKNNKIISFLNQMEDYNVSAFVKAASFTDDIDRLVRITDDLKGSDRKNFLLGAAGDSQETDRFMRLTESFSGEKLSKFLSLAAKAGNKVGAFLDMAEQLKNENIDKLFEFMEKLDSNDEFSNFLTDDNKKNILDTIA